MNFTMKFYSIVLLLIIVIFNNNYSLALKCIQCENTDKNCTIAPQDITNIVQCDDNRECFAKLAADGTIQRGCGANDVCKDDKNNCLQCKDDKGDSIPCNTEILPNPRPKCYVCEGANCLKIDDKTKVEYCQYFNKDSNLHCFTKIDNQNIIRGCLEKSEIKCDTADCKNCTNTEIDKPCNNDDVQPSDKVSCYECRSDAFDECNDPEKNKKSKNIEKKECKNKDKGCYAERWSGITFRGCAEVLNENETHKCLDNKNNCLICKDKSFCNAKVFNGAIINSISSILLIMSAFLTRNFFN